MPAISLLKEVTSSAGDVRFGERRVVELKGISEPQAILSVVWQG